MKGEKVYIGISIGNWKQELFYHRHSFSNPRLRNQTAHSKYFWNLKDQRLTPQIKWKIVWQFSTANSFNGRCYLFIDEKLIELILKIADYSLMNAMNLYLNVDIKVNLNYPNWNAPRLLLSIKTSILLLDDFYRK